MANLIQSSNPWAIANERYMTGLSDAEKLIFKQATIENLYYAASVAEKSHQANSNSRAIGKRLGRLVSGLQQYGAAIDTYANASSLVLCPLWGSIRVVLIAASEFNKYFDKVVTMFERIGDVIPRYDAYARIFMDNHEYLIKALSDAYLDILRFCTQAQQIFNKVNLGKGRSFKKIWTPFEADFDLTIERFHLHKDNIEQEANLVHMTYSVRERSMQIVERASQNQERTDQAVAREKQTQEEHAQHFERNRQEYERLGQQQERIQQSQERARQDSFRDLIKSEAGKDLLRRNGNSRALELQIILIGIAKERQTLLDFVSTHNNERYHQQILRRRHKDTCQWIIRHPAFSIWARSTRSSLLWNHGIPGCGKTILAATVIENLRIHLQPTKRLVSFYCHYAQPETLLAANILRSLLRQILELDIDISTHKPTILRLFSTPNIDTAEVVGLFLNLIASLSNVYIIIDGLDECLPEEHRYLAEAIRTIRSTNAGTRILLSSRHDSTIERLFLPSEEILITSKSISADVETYVRSVVNNMVAIEELCINPTEVSLIEEIIHALTSGAEGMFLWIILQLEDLKDQETIAGLRATVKSLPRGLPATFARALNKTIARGESQIQMVRRIFSRVVAAKRPLRVEELKEAVAFDSSDLVWSADKIPRSISRLVRSCGHLVTIDHVEGTVYLVHYTVQEYLYTLLTSNDPEGVFGMSQIMENRDLGELCVAYLSFADFETQLRRQPYDTQSLQALQKPMQNIGSMGIFGRIISAVWHANPFLQQKPPANQTYNVSWQLLELLHSSRRQNLTGSLIEKYQFLEYARDNWAFHTSDFDKSSPTTWTRFLDLAFHGQSRVEFRPWLLSENGEVAGIAWSWYKKVFVWAILNDHRALLLGLQQISTTELQTFCSTTIDFTSFDGSSGLVLTGRRADLNENGLDHSGHLNLRFPIQIATARNQPMVVDIIARAMTTNSFILAVQARNAGRSIIQMACQNGMVECLQALLKVTTDGVSDCLQKLPSLSGGHDILLSSLRSLYEDFNGTKDFPFIPLQLAVQNGHTSTVELLMTIPVDIWSSPPAESSAIVRAVNLGHIDTVRALLSCYNRHLEPGVQVSNICPAIVATRDPFYVLGELAEALRASINKGHEEIEKLLLSQVVNDQGNPMVAAQEDDAVRCRALVVAIRQKEDQVIMRLSLARIDLSRKDVISGKSAIDMAIQDGSRRVVSALLRHEDMIYSAFTSSTGPKLLAPTLCRQISEDVGEMAGKWNIIDMMARKGMMKYLHDILDNDYQHLAQSYDLFSEFLCSVFTQPASSVSIIFYALCHGYRQTSFHHGKRIANCVLEYDRQCAHCDQPTNRGSFRELEEMSKDSKYGCFSRERLNALVVLHNNRHGVRHWDGSWAVLNKLMMSASSPLRSDHENGHCTEFFVDTIPEEFITKYLGDINAIPRSAYINVTCSNQAFRMSDGVVQCSGIHKTSYEIRFNY